MSDQPKAEIEMLRAAYAAFNARNIEASLALMTSDVTLPQEFKGDRIHGHEAVRAYWTQQWTEINLYDEPVAFHLEEDGRIFVEVHQVTLDASGAVVADKHVGHRFTVEHGLIRSIEVCSLPSSVGS